jgi:DeoR/GlpR family transcriptional regulator of sugar metabolism
MKPRSRQERIAEIVSEHGRATVEMLAETLGASRETVRRDLTQLSEQGVIRKVHGGAVKHKVGREDPFGDRMEKSREAKLRIGQAAAALFDEGDSLFIDTGSTTVYFAKALSERSGLTIITNSQKVADVISAGSGTNEVYLLGGRYARENEQVVGPITIEQIKRFNADHAVLTVGAVDDAGRFMDFNAEEAYVARAMIERARSATVLADGSKLSRTALFEVCDATQIARVVTETAPSLNVANALRAAGVEVLIA